MTPTYPHYLLFSEASRNNRSAQVWRFVLQNVANQRRFSATDTEPADCGERLELLAVVRGLEALDGPARVTLVTKSRYVSRGIKSGLAAWRENGWSWERFGRMVPIRDHDLWRRVDRALRFHEVDCQAWQFDEATVETHETDEERVLPEVARPLKRTRPKQDRVGRALPMRQAASPAYTGGLVERAWAQVRRVLPRSGMLRATA